VQASASTVYRPVVAERVVRAMPNTPPPHRHDRAVRPPRDQDRQAVEAVLLPTTGQLLAGWRRRREPVDAVTGSGCTHPPMFYFLGWSGCAAGVAMGSGLEAAHQLAVGHWGGVRAGPAATETPGSCARARHVQGRHHACRADRDGKRPASAFHDRHMRLRGRDGRRVRALILL
jgi:hypothetical protein